jgi:hypothetical protein
MPPPPGYKPPFNAIAQLLQPDEFGTGWQLISATIGLSTFGDSFEMALELFDLGERNANSLRPLKRLLRQTDPFGKQLKDVRKSIETAHGWMHIAARDGAMQIYHCGAVMTTIKKNLYLAPTLLKHIDNTVMRNAVNFFKGHFPDYILIRDAVGHSIYEIAPTEAAFNKHAVPNTSIFITGVVSGRNYIITKDHKQRSYELSRSSLDKLRRSVELFTSSFAPCLDEVTKDWP